MSSSFAPATPSSIVTTRHDWIAILDFGSQYTHLIARRLRELGVLSRIVDGEADLATVIDVGGSMPSGVVLGGSPHSVRVDGSPELDASIVKADLPLLGICYGFQLLSATLGGAVDGASSTGGGEFGAATLRVERAAAHLDLAPDTSTTVWMSHGDEVVELPAGWHVLARTEAGAIAAASTADGTRVGLQFHPEVHHSERGAELFERWVEDVCGARREWTPTGILESLVERVRAQAGERHVLSFVSGGVDSTVATALVTQALGAERVHAVHVDNGLLRENESRTMVAALEAAGIPTLHVDASEEFYDALAGQTDPEQKRFAIGDSFIRVQERVERELGLPVDSLLCQGTLYPDMVESGFGVGKRAATMISHHNVGTPLVRAKREAGLLLEPLADLYKDEVRVLGRQLGLPAPLVDRQPFPGPGLALRILGEVNRERCEQLRRIDSVVFAAAREREIDLDAIWQLFCVLTGARAVGVHGDARSYGDVVALRACVSRDGMTADCVRFEWDDLLHVSARITEECREVSKVVYDISSKPPSNIEWE